MVTGELAENDLQRGRRGPWLRTPVGCRIGSSWRRVARLSPAGPVLGEIASGAGGTAWLDRLLDRNAAIAEAHGHATRPEVVAGFRSFFRTNPAATASMLRDLEAGGWIEADHILDFLLEAARRAGVSDELHEAAWLHAKAYEARRDAARLPRPSPG